MATTQRTATFLLTSDSCPSNQPTGSPVLLPKALSSSESYSTRTPKRPRQYAAEISQLKSRKTRAEALENVPEHLRALTKKHVEIYFAHRSK
jgi:hypothetical protein